MGARRCPAHIRQVGAGGNSLERRSDAGFSRPPSRHACRTRTVWQFRCVPSLSGLLSTLTGVLRIRLPPASPGCCDSPAEKVLHLLSVRPRLVALQVSHPQPVRCRGGEGPRDLVAGGRRRTQPAAELGAAGNALQAGAAHQQLHGVVADVDPAAQGELGMDPPAAIGLAGVGVDLADGVGQPGVADRPLRGGRAGQA